MLSPRIVVTSPRKLDCINFKLKSVRKANMPNPFPGRKGIQKPTKTTSELHAALDYSCSGYPSLE